MGIGLVRSHGNGMGPVTGEYDWSGQVVNWTPQ